MEDGPFWQMIAMAGGFRRHDDEPVAPRYSTSITLVSETSDSLMQTVKQSAIIHTYGSELFFEKKLLSDLLCDGLSPGSSGSI